MSKIFTKLGDTFKQNIFTIAAKQELHLISGQSNGASATNIVRTESTAYAGQSLRYQDGVAGGPIVDQKEYLNQTIASTMTELLILGYRSGNDEPQAIVITENHAVGGRNYAAIKKGGTEPEAYAKFITELTAMQAVRPTRTKVIHLVHGEADLTDPWEIYRDNLVQFLTDYTGDILAITVDSYQPIMIVSQISSQKVYQPTNVDIIESPLALLDVCRVSDRHFSCGPQYWIESNGGTDQVHLNGRDQIISSEYRKKVYSQVVDNNDRTTPTATMPVTVTLGTNYVDVVFDVPKPPLQFETDYIPAITDNGFVYSDDSGNTITSVTLLNATTVRVQLSGTVGTTPDLQYAWHNGNVANGVISGGPRGTLCDSETATSVYYTSYIMRNYALAFRYGAGYFTFS